MFIKVTSVESENRILINTDHIVSIIECDDFGYSRIVTDIPDPDLNNEECLLVYDVKEGNLASINEWKFG